MFWLRKESDSLIEGFSIITIFFFFFNPTRHRICFISLLLDKREIPINNPVELAIAREMLDINSCCFKPIYFEKLKRFTIVTDKFIVKITKK